MKKFYKLFILTLCSGFLFLGFNNAQNLEESDSITNEYDVSSTESWVSMDGDGRTKVPNIYVNTSEWCTCSINILELFSHIFLILIGIISCILLIALTVNAVTLRKKFRDTHKDGYLTYIPILNLYSISKITIGRNRFFCIILLVGFFGYSIYENMHRNRRCCPDPSRQDYVGIIIGILTIIMLSILISKLNTYFKGHSNKELTNK